MVVGETHHFRKPPYIDVKNLDARISLLREVFLSPKRWTSILKRGIVCGRVDQLLILGMVILPLIGILIMGM